MRKVLLVVDMQNICVGENHAECFQYDNQMLIKNVNACIKKYDSSLVIYIKNIMKDTFINKFAPFKAYEGTEAVEFVKDLDVVSDLIFTKYKGDAFSNPDLVQTLKEMEIEEIEIVGVDGGGCVPLTALGAISSGFQVVINTKAVGTMFEKNANKLNRKLRKKGAVFI